MDWRSIGCIPVGTKFSTPIQTSSGANEASYTMGTVSFPGVKWQGCGFNHPPSSGAKIKERENYTSTPTLYLHGRLLGDLYLYHYLQDFFFFYNICIKDIEDHVIGFIPILQLYGVMLHGYILYKQYKVPAFIGVNRNAYRVLVRKPEGSNHLEQLWVYG